MTAYGYDFYGLHMSTIMKQRKRAFSALVPLRLHDRHKSTQHNWLSH